MPENMKKPLSGQGAGLSAEELEIERALQSLAPVPVEVDRDAMMFAAGKAAAKRHALWPWQAACAAMMVVCAGFMVYRPVRVVERQVVVHVQMPASVQTVGVMPEQMGPVLRAFGEGLLRLDENPARERTEEQADYLHLRRAVLQHGLDALPVPKVSAGKAAAYAPPKKDDLFDVLPRWQRESQAAGGQL